MSKSILEVRRRAQIPNAKMHRSRIRDFFYAGFKLVCKSLDQTGITRYKLVGSAYDKAFKFLHPYQMSLEQVEGHKMLLDLSDGTCKMMSMFKFEPETTLAIRKALKPGMTFFDIGAHVGYFTLIGAKCVGNEGKVYSFEPVLKNFGLLKSNVDLNGYRNVSLNELAASNKNGHQDIYLSHDSAFHSLKLEAGKMKERIRTVTIDRFCRNNKIEKVDVVKLDVEGGELDALKGMSHTLKRNRNVILIVEYIPNNLRKVGSSPQEFVHMLLSLGFNRFFLLEDRQSRPISPQALVVLKTDICNVLAKKES